MYNKNNTIFFGIFFTTLFYFHHLGNSRFSMFLHIPASESTSDFSLQVLEEEFPAMTVHILPYESTNQAAFLSFRPCISDFGKGTSKITSLFISLHHDPNHLRHIHRLWHYVVGQAVPISCCLSLLITLIYSSNWPWNSNIIFLEFFIHYYSHVTFCFELCTIITDIDPH